MKDAPDPFRCNHPYRPRAIFQFPTRRFIVRSRKVSMPLDLCSKSCDRSSIWLAPRQQCCRPSCQILKRCGNLNYRLRVYDISRDLTIRRLVGYWNRAQVTLKYSQWIFCRYLGVQIEEILCRLPKFGTKDKFLVICVCQFHIHEIHSIRSSSGQSLISYSNSNFKFKKCLLP